MPRKRRNPSPKKEPKKKGVSGERFLKSPAFAGSRLAANEFGKASQCAVLLRHEFAQLLELPRQNDLHRRLSQKIGRLMRKRRMSGARVAGLNAQPWEELTGFEFNENGTLSSLLGLLPDKVSTAFSPATGTIDIEVTSFSLHARLSDGKAGSHGRVIACAAAIDFTKNKTAGDYSATDYFSFEDPPGRDRPNAVVRFSLQLPAPVKHPVFVALGITSHNIEKGNYSMTGNQRYKGLALVYVRPVATGA